MGAITPFRDGQSAPLAGTGCPAPGHQDTRSPECKIQKSKNGDTHCVCVGRLGTGPGSQRRPRASEQLENVDGASPPRLSKFKRYWHRRAGAGRGRGRDSNPQGQLCAAQKGGQQGADRGTGGVWWRSDSRFLSAAADDTTSRVLVTRGVLEEPNTNRRSRSGLQKDLAAPFLGHMASSVQPNLHSN